jgi:hypothetical protein
MLIGIWVSYPEIVERANEMGIPQLRKIDRERKKSPA